MIKPALHLDKLIINFTGDKPCVNPCPCEACPRKSGEQETRGLAGKTWENSASLHPRLALVPAKAGNTGDDAKVSWPWEFFSRPLELIHQLTPGVKNASSL